MGFTTAPRPPGIPRKRFSGIPTVLEPAQRPQTEFADVQQQMDEMEWNENMVGEENETRLPPRPR